MKNAERYPPENLIDNNETTHILDITCASFKKIAPLWPLKNLIAINPLSGLEDLAIEQALKQGAAYFEQKTLPQAMEDVNRQTIKWLQAYFDDGQATIVMPLRKKGLYTAFRQLALYDVKLHHNNQQKWQWLKELSQESDQAILQCLRAMGIAKEEHGLFLTLLLTTLPGWAGYIKYRTEWSNLDVAYLYPACQKDYLALRLIITTLLWPEAKQLIEWHKQALKQSETKSSRLEIITKTETTYRLPLLKKLATQTIKPVHTTDAQIVFCIDVRSEPFRKALESTGDYQTFGFAGFFGIPIQIIDTIRNESYASCPVLLAPKHEVAESSCSQDTYDSDRKRYERLTRFKRLYQSLKYTFTTPFGLAESIGILSGLWMGLRCLVPHIAFQLKKASIELIGKVQELEPSLDTIDFKDQCTYAQNILKIMGLTSHFAPIVVLCGHGSSTQNNAYATALDCGACAGRHGASNARILAAILNRPEVKAELLLNGIDIPQTIRFIAAEHNTTTDEVTLYAPHDTGAIKNLKANLEKARHANSLVRMRKMGKKEALSNPSFQTWLRSQDWAQVRPEWGLARNAAFIVAPRDITSSLDLEGRCFLHSYDYTQDKDGSSLTVILTAPMVVAQWINTQYLFSTLENVTYGSGSKITKNITGKIGIMQGNASDLMIGLPLQSVYSSDKEAYHEAQRLMTLVFAPLEMLDKVIHAEPVLKKLLGNGWVQMASIEPENRNIYLLNRDFTWKKIN